LDRIADAIRVRGYGLSWDLSPLTRFALDDAAHLDEQIDLSPLGRAEEAADTLVQPTISSA
jgi:hypothetical protein